jgi:amidohydrolase
MKLIVEIFFFMKYLFHNSLIFSILSVNHYIILIQQHVAGKWSLSIMSEQEQAFDDWLVNLRRDFHAHPEVSFKENRTTEKISELLTEMGIEAQRFENHTGVVALLEGKSEGPTIGLRADIDALPVHELRQISYRSLHDGCMHACGHDANTAIMLGVARRLVESGTMQNCRGNVKFIFQPAEERLSGANTMINAGVLENPKIDCLLAGHMSPDLPIGHIGIFKKIGYASSDSFVITIAGKGTHGARPEDGNDPIVAGAALVTLLQSIVSRNVKPTLAGVITVGMFQGGAADNVIPESVKMAGTIRALDENVRQTLMRRLREVVDGIAITYGVNGSVNIHDGSPVLVVDEAVSTFVYETAREVEGVKNVSYVPPIMGSEDFAFFTRLCPATIIRLGSSNISAEINHPLHSPYFDIDERVLGIGVDIFFETVNRYLSDSDYSAN